MSDQYISIILQHNSNNIILLLSTSPGTSKELGLVVHNLLGSGRELKCSIGRDPGDEALFTKAVLQKDRECYFPQEGIVSESIDIRPLDLIYLMRLLELDLELERENALRYAVPADCDN